MRPDPLVLFGWGEIQDWRRTENPEWLGDLDEIKVKLANGDPTLWNQEILVTEVDGLTYILNGHHRLTAVVESRYAGDVPITVVPSGELLERFNINPGDLLADSFGAIGG